MMIAINGGKPTRDIYLPYGHQYLDDSDIEAVVNVLKSDFLTTGPVVEDFEQEICAYIGCKYAVAVSSGTAALHLACMAIDLKEDDEVITTPMTFAASSNCILYCESVPVFSDIDIENYNIDVDMIESKITERTKAILAVDYTGQCCDIGRIMKLAKRYNLKVIEDGAHSIGTKYKGEHIGSIADVTTFSFHPVKSITCGEGGIITTNSKQIYEKLILFRNHGITKSKEYMNCKEYPSWYYEQVELGYNYRITDIQCALGISQLKKIDLFIDKRKYLVDLYNKKFKSIDGVIVQKEESYSDTARHLYILRIDLNKFNATRDNIYNALIAENIGVNIHYIPIYKHPYYSKLGYKEDLCENTELLYKSMITMPLHVNMNKDDVDDVVEALSKVLDYYRK